MFRSVRFKMTVVLILILGGILLLAYIMSSFYSENYYLSKEKRNLFEAYQNIKEMLESSGDYENPDDDLDEFLMESNIRVFSLKISEDTLSVRGYGNEMKDDNRMYGEMYHYLEGIFQYQSFREWLLNKDEESKAELIEMLEDSEEETDQQILKLVTEGYFITDPEQDERYNKGLYLFGCSSGEYLLAMRIPFADIRESAAISRQLTMRIGLLGIVLGSIIMFSYASTFTKPIKEIAEASERMADLDFDVKVHTDRQDEIGMLAHSINRMSMQLEHTIADLKSANAALMKDIEKREQIDEMRKDFVSHVSHELKTPIALIQGYAEGLKDNVNEDEESRNFYCDVITDEAMKMNNLVSKLLNLTQIEFGNNAPDIRRFDLYQMVNNKLAASRILFKKKNVRVKFEETGPVYVWADELMIEEVFSNYLSNALNHVKEGGRITVTFERLDKNLRLHVYNDGDPIPDEDLDKIWIKFYKVDKARTREYGGSGIGLSLVAASMDAHGKDYGVDNKEEGVDFWFDLDHEKL